MKSYGNDETCAGESFREAGFMRLFNPICKFALLLAFTLILSYKHDPVLSTAVFILSLILMIVSRVNMKMLAALMVPVALLAVCMFFTGYRFFALDSMPVSADVFDVGSTAVWNGMIHASRVAAYAGAGLLFALTTDKIYMMRAAQQQLHLPQAFAYGILAAWGIFPGMAKEYRRTKAAFRARGQSVMFVSPRLLVPLLVKTIRWSEELSIAMKSKGFSETSERTAYEVVKLHRRDYLISAAGVVIAAAMMMFPS